MDVHRHHVVLGLRLETLVGAGAVELLQTEKLVLVERGEELALRGAEIAARALDPEHFGLFAGERILLDDLRRGVSAAGIGDALIAAEEVRAIDEAANRIELKRPRRPRGNLRIYKS